jgi:hypothetical protein
MNNNKSAMQITLQELKHLEQKWREQMRNMVKAKLDAETTVDTIQQMTVVQGQLCKLMIELEGQLK